jgi:hypothetical protein
MKFYVKFIGYGAQIVTGRGVECARLDFVTGITHLQISGGYIRASNRQELSCFVTSLSTYLQEIKNRPKAPHRNGYMEWTFGDSEIGLIPDANAEKILRKFQVLFCKIKSVLEQAEIMGLQIERRPYSEFIEEIESTGIARIEVHGVGVFKNGKLVSFQSLNTICPIQFVEREPCRVSFGGSSTRNEGEEVTAYYDQRILMKDAAARARHRHDSAKRH